MENQQNNLYQQSQQPLPSTPQQLPRNKWWNWKDHEMIKICGLICTLFNLSFICLVLIIIFSPRYQYQQDPEGLDSFLTVVLFGFFALLFWLPSIIVNLYFVNKQKYPDKIDKIFFASSMLPLIIIAGMGIIWLFAVIVRFFVQLI